MYFSYKCSYCGRLFYTYNADRHGAAKSLYHGIKQHLTEYDEDRKEHQFDDGPQMDTDEVYSAMAEASDRPAGGYELK